MNDQLNIFSSSSLERLKIDKPIRLIELFAGYGSQSLALKYLNADYESYRICEWNYKSFEAYKRLHFPNDDTDYSKGMSTEQLKKWVVGKGVSADWNKPIPQVTVNRMGDSKLREIYNSAMATHNLVDISRVSSSNLGIERERETIYISYDLFIPMPRLVTCRKESRNGGEQRNTLLAPVAGGENPRRPKEGIAAA